MPFSVCHDLRLTKIKKETKKESHFNLVFQRCTFLFTLFIEEHLNYKSLEHKICNFHTNFLFMYIIIFLARIQFYK